MVHGAYNPNFMVLTVLFHRYVNMDYILAEVLKHHLTSLHKIITYDIVCQWSKNLEARLNKLPSSIRLSNIGSHDELIPKLHVLTHKAPCPTQRSLNYHVGSGCTDGRELSTLMPPQDLCVLLPSRWVLDTDMMPWIPSGTTGAGIRWLGWVGLLVYDIM